MATINLTKGYKAIVDKEDLPLLSNYSWCSYKANGKEAAYAKSGITIDGKQHTLRMHRLLLGLPINTIEVDHINGNGLDNRRINLRLCSRTENNRNAKKRSDSYHSKFKGVSQRKNRWRCVIGSKLVRKHLGYFDTEIEAAKAYNKEAKMRYGSFALLNEV